jgi:hypothetical protein
MSPNDITTLAEINTENGKEKDWEKLLHYIYEDNGNRIIKLIDGRGVKS